VPPPRVEFGVLPPPGPGYVLEPGHWHWTGGRYVWIGRHWVRTHAVYVHYVPGHWSRDAYGRPFWVAAHWSH
jgi:hypothetical protein